MKNRLKVLRAERDWTQARLATELEVSRQTVNAVETGKYDTLNRLEQLRTRVRQAQESL